MMRSLFVVGVVSFMIHTGFANPPGLPSDWSPVAALSDEFEGDRLDAVLWHDRDPKWAGRVPVMFDPQCVTVTNGQLHLAAPKSDERPLAKGYTHRSGSIMARKLVRYGYFEIRAKLLDSTLVSCFWLYNHDKAEWTEIDIFEAPAGVPEYRKSLLTNVHVFYSPTYKGTQKKHLQDSSAWKAPFDVSADYHVYGLEWNKEVIRWYVDGVMIRERKNDFWHQPLYLCINIEANTHFKALPDNAVLPGVYKIDYIRAWERQGVK